MTRVERFLAAIDGDASYPPVWTADLSYWISGSEEAEERFQSEEGYLELCDQLGCMPYYWYDSFWAADRVYAEAPEVYQGSGNERTTRWRIDSEVLQRIECYSPVSHSEAIVKYPVETVTDLRNLIRIVERSELHGSAALEEYPERRTRWESHDGLPCLGLPRSPLPAFITEWAGVENGILLLVEEPDLCVVLFDLLSEQEMPILEALATSVPLVHFPDNITSEVYTSLFDSYMREHYVRRLEILHGSGSTNEAHNRRNRTRCAVHLDGTVNGMLQKICSVGIDAVEAVTPLPVGDMSVDAMREVTASSSTVLWGGVPGAMFAQPHDREAMERHVTALLEAWRNTPFILGVADQVPPDGDINLVEMITRIVEDVESA